jgi:hypothetical protein
MATSISTPKPTTPNFVTQMFSAFLEAYAALPVEQRAALKYEFEQLERDTAEIAAKAMIGAITNALTDTTEFAGSNPAWDSQFN